MPIKANPEIRLEAFGREGSSPKGSFSCVSGMQGSCLPGSQIEPVWIKLRLWFGGKCLHPKMFRVHGSPVCSFSKLYPSISAPRECPIILAGGQHIS